ESCPAEAGHPVYTASAVEILLVRCLLDHPLSRMMTAWDVTNVIEKRPNRQIDRRIEQFCGIAVFVKLLYQGLRTESQRILLPAWGIAILPRKQARSPDDRN